MNLLMKSRFQAVRCILPLSISMGFCQCVAAQPPTPTVELPHSLTVEEVVTNMVRRNVERAKRLGSFQGTRVYRLEYHGFPGSRSAEMVVDVKYQAPETKEFNIRSATGSNLLIQRVFKKLLESEKEAATEENQDRVVLNNDNYQFSLVDRENTPAGSFYILSVEPRTRNKLLYRGRIWVDATDFAVTRIEAAPAKNPSFWIKDTSIEHSYVKIGDFWLPASNRSTTTTRLGGHALLTIEYKDYRVTAIPRTDSITTVARHR